MIDEVVNKVESTIVAIARQGSGFLKESELDVRIAEVKRKTEQLVRENPIKSLVIGTIIGFLIGRVLSRNQ